MSDPFKTAVFEMIATTDIPADQIAETNAVEDRPPMPYSVVSVSPAETGRYRLSAEHGLRMRRIVVQSFGRTLDGVLDYDATIESVLLDKRPTVAGWQCGPCLVEVSGTPTPDPDDDRVIGLTNTYTFTTTKETP